MKCRRLHVLLFLCLLAFGARPVIGQDPLTTLSAVRGLSDAERAGRPDAKVTGLVISRLPNERLFCLYDGETGILILNSPEQALTVGERVEIEGRCLPDVGFHLAATTIRSLGTVATLPVPKADTQARLDDPDAAFLWTEAEAVIRGLHITEVGWHLKLNMNGKTFTALVPRRGKAVTPEFHHARVRVRGIIAPLNLLGEESDQLGIWVDDWNRILRLDPPRDPGEIPAQEIADLVESEDGKLDSRRVKLRGQAVQIGETGEIVLRDGVASIAVIPNRLGIAQVNDHLEVLGYLELGPQGVIVAADGIRSYGLAGTTAESGDWSGMRELQRSIAAIRELDETGLLEQPPVRLTGVITMVDTNDAAFYLMDEKGSIRVNSASEIGQLAAGDRITVSGVAKPGSFGPVIELKAMNWIEHSVLSAPQDEISGTRLIGGRHEAERIAFSGVVRRVEPRRIHTWLHIAYSDRRFHVRMPHGLKLPRAIIGARVRVDAIVQARANEAGQVVGVNLLVADKSRFRIVKPALANPHEMNRVAIGSLLRFQPEASYIWQKRVVGKVLLAWPYRLFLQDDSGSVEVLAHEPHDARVGDRVSAVGFTRLADLQPKLVDSIIRTEGPDALPEPQITDAGMVLSGDFHGRRLRLQGILHTVASGADEYSLALHHGSTIFEAALPGSLGGEKLLELAPGSLIELTGLCAMRPAIEGHSQAFSLLLNDAADVRVLKQPSWWTPERSVMIVVLLVLLTVAVLGWVQRLRGHVAESRSTLAASLETSPVATCIISWDGKRMLAANRAFLRQFGFTRADVGEKNLDELGIWIKPAERVRVLQLCHERGIIRGIETQMRSGAGNTLRILLSGESIKWERSRAYLLAAQDVTERFELVNQLRESQKMEAVGQLAAGVAHDFNNILTIIRGNAEMLADSIGNDTELVELNDNLLNAAGRASELTRQLLAFSRKQFMRPQILNLNEVVEDSLRMLKPLLGAPIVVQTELHPKPTHIYADTGMLDQVLMNLAVNSRDALPNGGDLRIMTRIVRFAPGSRHAGMEAETGPMVQLRVTDNGAGMPPETLEKVFEPFFTTKDVGKGTGLGLATVFGIVKQHRGWVEGESEVGLGTNINIFFPIAETAEDVDADVEPAMPELMGDETILAVEDEPQLIRMVERTFEKHGYTVYTAENGVIARELWEQHRDKIDLFFTDIVLPRGISGWDLAEEFGALKRDMLIVYTSGYSPEFDAKGSILERGVNYIPKPFNQRQLLTIVRDSLARNDSDS